MKDEVVSWEEAVLWLRSQPDQADLVRACYFDDPLAEAAERFYRSTEWAEIRRLLPGGKGKVLDLGAGRGISSYGFAREGWTVTASEPDPSGIVGAGAIRQLAKESNLHIEVLMNFAESLPFHDNSFELVYGRQVLHHASDLQQMCNEIHRVLKPGGMFLATREHVISRKEDREIFLSRHPLQKIYGGENAFLLEEYVNAIRRSGIRLIKILNPRSSDINLFPESRLIQKKRIAERIHVRSPELIPSYLLHLLGEFDHSPGRLYSFVGRKNHD